MNPVPIEGSAESLSNAGLSPMYNPPAPSVGMEVIIIWQSKIAPTNEPMDLRTLKALDDTVKALEGHPLSTAYKSLEEEFLRDPEVGALKRQIGDALLVSEDTSKKGEEREKSLQIARMLKENLENLDISKRYFEAFKAYRDLLNKIDLELFLPLTVPSFHFERLIDDKDRRG